MRLGFFVALLSLCLAAQSAAQPFFPVRIDKKWGLINADGQLVQQAVYDAIGEFKHYGYALMQRNGKVGLLGQNGQEILAPAFDDLKVLTSELMAALRDDQWAVINLQGKTVLPPGYDRARALNSEFIAYLENGAWGVVNRHGRKIVDCRYDELRLEPEGYFISFKDGNMGALSWEGDELLPPAYDDIRFEEQGLLFFKKQNRWGVADCHSGIRVPAEYEAVDLVGQNFIRLRKNGKLSIYSLSCERVVSQGAFDDCYLFSGEALLVKNNRLLGLIGACGQILLPPRYYEIHPFANELYRVNYQGQWGIVETGGIGRLPLEFDYIAPLKNNCSLARKGGKTGLLNAQGKLVANPVYDQIFIEENLIKAYEGEALTLLALDQGGELADAQRFNQYLSISVGKQSAPAQRAAGQSPYVLDRFEWFYAPKLDKWGLRSLQDGTEQIQPLFDFVRVYPQFGFSLAGVASPISIDLERTTYRFERVYGMVNNEEGLLVTDLSLWDLRVSDFQQGLPAARVVFSNGRHGLIAPSGKILARDIPFIGEFSHGRARAGFKGRLSGALDRDALHLGPVADYLKQLLTPNYMLDFTQYDLAFERNAQLICDDCLWGFIDTAGAVIASPQYSFAGDFTNEVAIVQQGDKWGLIGLGGETLIPSGYDEIEFLENTGNQILRIYKREQKYGLIDSLGQLALPLAFDELGSFREGFLAVKQDGLWGFADRQGQLVVPCRFRAVENFSDGIAAAKLGRKWGFINAAGETVIDFQFIRVGNFRSGLAWFFDGARYGFIDEKGEVAIPAQFDRAFDFEGPVARVIRDFKYGLIDRKGRFVLKPKYSIIHPFQSNGLAKAGFGGDYIYYGLINRAGLMVTNQSFIEIRPFSEGLAAAKTKNGYGFLDENGKMVIPDRFPKVSNFSDGRAAVQENNRCGYISRDGTLVVDMAFSKCLDFSEGRAVVYQGYRKAGLIDSSGRFIILPSLDNLAQFSDGRGLMRNESYRFYYITEKLDAAAGTYDDARTYHHGIAVVQSNGQWGLINQNGMEIVPPKYDRIGQFENGYAKVRIKGFTGISNLKGELIVQPDYEYISYAGDGLFRVEQGEKIGYFDLEGRWVWGLRE